VLFNKEKMSFVWLTSFSAHLFHTDASNFDDYPEDADDGNTAVSAPSRLIVLFMFSLLLSR